VIPRRRLDRCDPAAPVMRGVNSPLFSAPIVRAQDKGARILARPPSLGLFWRGGAWSGVPGVGARCGNGLFSTYKSPKFYLSFTILVSFILVRYPDRIGLVNTVPTVPTVPVPVKK